MPIRLLVSISLSLFSASLHEVSAANAEIKKANQPVAEAFCGPEIVLLGDAWKHAQLERDGLFAMVKSGSLEKVPQRTAALLSHVAFMQAGAIMVFGKQREFLADVMLEMHEALPHWNALALTDRREELAAEWSAMARMVETIGAQFPKEALVSSSDAGFVLPPVVPSLQISLDPEPILRPGEKTTVRFRLTDSAGKPVASDFLHSTNTKKLQALLLDPLFTDYHDEHPQPTGNPGEYAFEFTPARAGPYRLWLDVVPVATGRREFPTADLMKIPQPIIPAPALSTTITSAEVGGFRLRLELPQGGLIVGGAAKLSVILEEVDGQPLKRLQPIMGAFAHVMGVADDFKTILHIHPIGAMPTPDQLGGPKIDFQVRPCVTGSLKLFFQFQVDGTGHFAEFLLPVREMK